MVKKVLIVDDNREMLLSLKDGLDKYGDSFSITIGVNGLQALKVLKKEAISLVVTDLKMPRMDGFALLTHIMEHYPDIAVIMMTAYSTPEMKKMARHGGAVGYIEKPFMIDDLARKVIARLRKTAEGGTLHSVSSGIFLQFIEMEERTCTIRLSDKDSGRQGVLFFRKGELIGARTERINGERAAYEIFSWDKTSLSIQNDCLQKKRTIHNDLQAIFLDALLLKDEKDDEKRTPNKVAPAGALKSERTGQSERTGKTPKRGATSDAKRSIEEKVAKGNPRHRQIEKTRQKTIPAAVKRSLEETVIQSSLRNLQVEKASQKDGLTAGKRLPEETVAESSLKNLKIEESSRTYGSTTKNRMREETVIKVFPKKPQGGTAQPPNISDRVESIRRKVEQEIGKSSGLEDVYSDASWDDLIVEFEKIGAVFNAGRLKAGHVDKGAALDFILIPGRETTVATVSPKCSRDTIMQVLGDE